MGEARHPKPREPRGQKARAGLAVFYNPYEAGAAGAAKVLEESLAFLEAGSFSIEPAPAMVHDIATARQAGKFFNDRGLRVIIVHLATWAGDDSLVELESWLEGPRAIILWALRDMNSGSLCGCQQFNMVRYELEPCEGDIIIGRDAKALETFDKLVRAYHRLNDGSTPGRKSEDETVQVLISDLRHVRVGIFGARTPGMMEVAYDEFGIKRVIGPSIHAMPVAELERRASRQPVRDMEAALASFKEAFQGATITASPGAIDVAMRNYLALKELIEERGLDAVTIDCYPSYMGRACVAFSELAGEGIPCACEADVHAAILAWILQRLSGGPTNHIDTLDVDPDRNTLTGGHCGSCSIRLARPGSATVAPVRLANEGACVVFPQGEGPVTLANLVGRESTFRACVITGTAVESGLVFPGNPVVIKLDVPVGEFLDTVSNCGLGHHWVVGRGTHYARTLDELLRALGIRVCKVL
ncbi:MAG: hypothetical protein JW839_13330 [Candidatus Lokiarchaeota archaeon]|nr:hypothetical protein [Candidatus Lokiarchaeota archaeon]